MEQLKLTQEWDKVFPKNDKVEHSKATFHNRYGITLAADVYVPKNAEGKLPAIAVGGPFGAVKEQSSGLYAQKMAELGFFAIAFDPSYTGESGGMPRYVASPDINAEDSEQARFEKRKALNEQRTEDYKNGSYALAGGVVDPLPEDAPQFVADYYAYYKTPRGYHPRSLGSNGGWNVTSSLSFLNMPILQYAGEIRSAVLLVHGEKAHSRYFSETAYGKLTGDNKELFIIPGANHTDLYDQMDVIPFGKLKAFFEEYLK